MVAPRIFCTHALAPTSPASSSSDGDAGQHDDELVDHPPAATLEDVDRRHVAVDGADPAGDLAPAPGPVG